MEDLFSQDIFSQYEDNLMNSPTVDNVNDVNKDDDTKKKDDLQMNQDDNKKTIEETQNDKPNTKIIPTFGKQSHNKARNKTQSKPKKFVPPTKTNNKIDTENSKSNATQPILEDTTQNLSNKNFEANTFDPTFANFDETLTNIDPIDSFQHLTLDLNPIFNDNYSNTAINDHEVAKIQNINKAITLSGILTGSYNILNNDDYNISLQNTQNSDKSVQNLTQKTNSICSVASLKVYKDLDAKSFEMKPEKLPPTEEDFLNLFKRNTEMNNLKPVAMSIENGDMGFNMKYSDYVKSHHLEDEQNDEVKVTVEKILEMYPKENCNLIKMKRGKKN